MDLVRPKALKRGDTLGIVAPAGPVTDRPRWEAAVRRLEGEGFRLKVFPGVLGEPHGYLAATDRQRRADLHAAFEDPGVDGILCAKGGYGSLRLLEGLDFDRLARNPKPFIGFSDITTLHLAIQARTGLVTFHGPMLVSSFAGHGGTEENLPGLWDAVCGQGSWPRCVGEGQVLVPGAAEGWLAGGNLATLVHLVGTPWMPDLSGALLFLEDLDEEPYRLDRYLTQLRLSGALSGVAGIACGDFLDCVPTALDKPSFTVEEVLLDAFGDLGVPVVTGLPFGHGQALPTFPVGGRARLEAGTLSCLEPGVSPRD